MYIQPQSPLSFGRSPSVVETIDSLWRGKWLLIVGGLLFALLAVALLAIVPHSYRATTKILLEPAARNVSSLDGLMIDGGFSTETLNNEVEVLRSSLIVGRLADEIVALAEYPEKGGLASAAAAQVETIRLGLKDGGAGTGPDATARLRLELVSALGDAITLQPIVNSRVIEISAEALDPDFAAWIANRLVALYMGEQSARKLSNVRDAADLLTPRVRDLQERVRVAELAVAKFKESSTQSPGLQLDTVRQRLNALNTALADERNHQRDVGLRMDFLAKSIEQNAQITSVPEFRDSKLLQSLNEEMGDLQLALIDIGANGRTTSKEKRATEAKIAEVESKIAEEKQAILSGLRLELDQANRRASSIVEEVADLRVQEADLSRREVRLGELEFEADSSKRLYGNFLDRLNEVNEQTVTQTADAVVLSPAFAPIEPVSRHAPLLLAVSLLFGVGAGSAAVLAYDGLRGGVRTPEQAEAATGRPVVSQLPALAGKGAVWRLLDRERGVSTDLGNRSRDPVAEGALEDAVRDIRTHLLQKAAVSRVVLLTSVRDGDGKSSTAALLARSCQSLGKSVLLVDCDLHRAGLSVGLGLHATRYSIADVVERGVAIAEATVFDPSVNAHVLPASAHVPDGRAPRDVLAAPGFEQLLAEAITHFDLVILDAPPALAASAVRILLPRAGVVMLLSRWGTPLRRIARATDQLAAGGARSIGLVLTMVPEGELRRYGRSYGFERKGPAT